MRLKSNLNVCALLIAVSLTLPLCIGYQAQFGRGKFESYNGNRYTEAKSLGDNGTKIFFGINRNRPPAHDTPASACSCSKFFGKGAAPKIVISSEFRSKGGDNDGVWKSLMQIDPTFSFATASHGQIPKLSVALIAKVFFFRLFTLCRFFRIQWNSVETATQAFK